MIIPGTDITMQTIEAVGSMLAFDVTGCPCEQSPCIHTDCHRVAQHRLWLRFPSFPTHLRSHTALPYITFGRS
jgi:hypothetical protein